MLHKGLFYFSFLIIFSQIAFAKETIHVVKEGETLSHVADKYNVPAVKIKEANNKKTDVVWVGMKLVIPEVKSQEKDVKPQEKKHSEDFHKATKSLTDKPKTEVKSNTDGLVHTFKEGETLWSVAKQYGVSPDEIKALNNKKTDVVWVGMKLKIKENEQLATHEVKEDIKSNERKEKPKLTGKETIHVVKEGETLSHVADKYNVPAVKIKEANNKKTDVVWVGMKLIIPEVTKTEQNEETQTPKTEQAKEEKSSTKPAYPTTSRSYKKVQHGIEFKYQGDGNVAACLSGTVLVIVDTIDHLKPVVVIKHGDQTTIYGKLTNVSVKQGDKVKKGQVIGTYGQNGLYFAYRENGDFSDPVDFLS